MTTWMLPPDLFTAETPLGLYQGFTEKEAMSLTTRLIFEL